MTVSFLAFSQANPLVCLYLSVRESRLFVHSPFMFALDPLSVPLSQQFPVAVSLICQNVPKDILSDKRDHSVRQTWSQPLPSQRNCPWPKFLSSCSLVLSRKSSRWRVFTAQRQKAVSPLVTSVFLLDSLRIDLGPEHSLDCAPLKETCGLPVTAPVCLLRSYSDILVTWDP